MFVPEVKINFPLAPEYNEDQVQNALMQIANDIHIVERSGYVIDTINVNEGLQSLLSSVTSFRRLDMTSVMEEAGISNSEYRINYEPSRWKNVGRKFAFVLTFNLPNKDTPVRYVTLP